jgi:imidazolonepropionase-like amidohydrolase
MDGSSRTVYHYFPFLFYLYHTVVYISLSRVSAKIMSLSKFFALLAFCDAIRLTQTCQFHQGQDLETDYASIVERNNQFRAIRSISPYSQSKIVINNVRVFNGVELLQPGTIVIDGDVIGTDPSGATEQVDGQGGVLLPGLIDTHTHPSNITHLQDLSRYGVTTCVSMACFFPELCRSLQNHVGLVDVVLGSLPASAPGSIHGNIVAAVDRNQNRLVFNSSTAPQWIDEQVASGADFIKLIAESPGLDQETLNALTKRSHEHRKRVTCHAATFDAYEQAAIAKVNDIHHSPIDKQIDVRLAKKISCQGQTTTPTLSIMRAIVDMNPSALNYSAAKESVRLLREAGTTILAGTDANQQQGLVVTLPFGSSLHNELELLVDAGLSPINVLQAATSLAAKHWNLHDRGVIAPGKRADLVLVTGDPTRDITATRNIKRVWLAGVEYPSVMNQH